MNRVKGEAGRGPSRGRVVSTRGEITFSKDEYDSSQGQNVGIVPRRSAATYRLRTCLLGLAHLTTPPA